jgi:beta-alanine--pyruvate transaminase
MDVYEEEGIFDQARSLEPLFEDLLHSFREHDKVIDARNFGLMGAIELAPRDGAPGARGLEVHKRAFWDEQLVIRNGLDVLQFSPFLNSKPDEMEASFDAVRRILDTLE